jgi:hypothetical protein
VCSGGWSSDKPEIQSRFYATACRLTRGVNDELLDFTTFADLSRERMLVIHLMINTTTRTVRHCEGQTTETPGATSNGIEPRQIREVFLDDRLMKQREAAAILGLSPRTLESMRLRSVGPPFVRVSRRCVRYRRTELERFIASCTVQTTVIQPISGNGNG